MIKMQLDLPCIIGTSTAREEECCTSFRCQMWPHLHASTACCSTASGSGCLATGGAAPLGTRPCQKAPSAAQPLPGFPSVARCSTRNSRHQPSFPDCREVWGLLLERGRDLFFLLLSSSQLLQPPLELSPPAPNDYVGPGGSGGDALGSTYLDNKTPRNPTGTLKPVSPEKEKEACFCLLVSTRSNKFCSMLEEL